MGLRHVLVLFALFCMQGFAPAADWPQWLGPNRNGASPEKGLLARWPNEGPKLLWKVEGGEGFSTLAVAGTRAFTILQRGGAELAVCLSTADGKELWSTRLGPAYKNNYGNGPRSTPTVDGKLVYVQSVTGPLVCLAVEDGEIAWQHHLLDEFGAKNISWGLCASPLVENDLVIALPGANGAGVAAFDKKTGALAWKSTDDKAAYASPIAVSVGGQRQIIAFTALGVVGLSSEGSEMWRLPWRTEFDCNIATPQVIGDKMFITSGEKNGCALYQLGGGAPSVVWESKGPKSVMINYWATSVVHDGHLFGPSGEFDKAVSLNCVELATGKLKWRQPNFGLTSVTLADGKLFLVTKKGELVLAEANPQAYRELGRCAPLGENYTAATIADGKLFVRDEQHILCFAVK